MREGHLGRGTDYIDSQTEQNVFIITHNSALLLLKVWHKGQYFLWVSKSPSVRMILHQRHSNKASLDICISTSQGTWLSNIFTHVTLKFEGWPWKTSGNLSYAYISYALLFVSISKIKLEVSSRNAQIGPKSTFFQPLWPWNLTDDLDTQ